MPKKIKFIPGAKLFALNNKAIKAGKNRALDPDHLKQVCNVNLNYPVIFDILHNDFEMRVMFAWTNAGKVQRAMLDMEIDDFLDLPEYEMETA